MSMRVRDFMQEAVHTVRPTMTVIELEHAFLEHRVSGFPVVTDGSLVGVVSRSDIVRALEVEHTYEEQLSDYYGDWPGTRSSAGTMSMEAVADVGARVGARVDGLLVRDVMMQQVVSVSPGEALERTAEILVEHGIHRLPVTEGGRLVGIVTSLDLIRLIAEKRLVPA